MSDEAKRLQVADQCRVVAHLAEALAGVHKDKEALFRAGLCDDIVDLVGRQTASIMEDLGDILNGMDAVTEDDDWTHPVFEKRASFGFGPSDA